MAGNLEKECSALGGLFQCIINDMKNGYPVWEDFIQKATKMHFQLKAAVAAVSVFLDALQRVADLATSAKGATRDIGTALTRICLRHRSIENRLKTMASALVDCLLLPLQENLEEWRRTVATLDKEHSREYKRARNEIKKRSLDSGRLQKKVRKGQNSMQRMLDSAVQEVNDRYFLLLETERKGVRQALTEQRSQFCIFVSWFKPFLDGEMSLLNEITQLQEVADLLYKHSSDPYTLPPSSEAVIADVKGLGNTWRFQTPPSSPGSSLGSRKSSYCSLGPVDGSCRAQSLASTPLNPPKEVTFTMIGPEEEGSTAGSCDETSQVSTPSVSPSAFTWPECAYIQPTDIQRSPQLQRPRTISTAYSARGSIGLKRPVLNAATFTPPAPVEMGKGSPKPRRSSSQDPSTQRPPLPQKYKPVNLSQLTPISTIPSNSSVEPPAAPSIPDFNQVQPNQVIPQPEYANFKKPKPVYDSASLEAGGRLTQQKQRPRRPMSFACSDESSPFLNVLTMNDGRDFRLMIRDYEEGVITPLAATPTGSIVQTSRFGPAYAPPPPVRRSSSITAATPSAPAIDLVRSYASAADNGDYAIIPEPAPRPPSVSSTSSRAASTGSRQGGVPEAQVEYGPAYTNYQPRGGLRAESEPPIAKQSI